jgi:anti-anti-sigma factor
LWKREDAVTAGEVAPQEYLEIKRDPLMPAGGGRATFVVRGELDIATMDRLIEAVVPDAVRGAHLVLDLSSLEFMDGSGIRALTEILSAIGPAGRLIIRRPSRPVRRVLEIVGADALDGLVIATA